AVGAAGDAITIGIIRIFVGQDGRFRDGLKQSHTDERRCNTGGEARRLYTTELITGTAQAAFADPALQRYHAFAGSTAGRLRLQRAAQLRMRITIGIAHLEHPLIQRLAQVGRRRSAVAYVTSGTAIIHIMRTGFAWHTFEHTVFRVLVMLPIDKGGVMHATAQHEGLAIV